MQARKIKGRMLFITSLHAHTPRNLPHHSATKAGQTMIAKELARALGADGIRVSRRVGADGSSADRSDLSFRQGQGRQERSGVFTGLPVWERER
jgi:hypothetical protein